MPGTIDRVDVPIGWNHGGGPTRAILDEGLHWMQLDKVVPGMRFSTASDYFRDINSKVDSKSPVWDYAWITSGYTPPPAPSPGKIGIPTWKSELYFEYHRGVMTTQASHQRNLRQSSIWTLNAEPRWRGWMENNPQPKP